VRRATVIFCNGQAGPRFAAAARRPGNGHWAWNMPTWRSTCTNMNSVNGSESARKSCCGQS
jgi:hypothetical protein